jgi:hypothetical protein
MVPAGHTLAEALIVQGGQVRVHTGLQGRVSGGLRPQHPWPLCLLKNPSDTLKALTDWLK